jgi:hypothetical protein
LNLEHALAKPVRRSFKPQDTRTSTNPEAVLKDLFELLEEYGPIWYTEELHARARIALSEFQ